MCTRQLHLIPLFFCNEHSQIHWVVYNAVVSAYSGVFMFPALQILDQ